MACPRSMTQKKKERKDGMPEKHDPIKKESVKKKSCLIVHQPNQSNKYKYYPDRSNL